MKLEVTINGTAQSIETEGHRRLLDVLREELNLVGTKEGCGEGECGACTVILEGQVVNSCLVAVGQVQGKTITTIEGMAQSGTLHVVQDALIRFGGAQCGICTPGVALCAKWALDAEPEASSDRLRELMAGNVCRCTGYQAIIDAVVEVQNRKGASDE